MRTKNRWLMRTLLLVTTITGAGGWAPGRPGVAFGFGFGLALGLWLGVGLPEAPAPTATPKGELVPVIKLWLIAVASRLACPMLMGLEKVLDQ